MEIVFLSAAAYLFGSVPTGYIVTRKLLQKDIRRHGSGNVGATNVARKLGFKMGAAVAAVDIAKGFIPVMLGRLFLPEGYPLYFLYLIGLAAILGHDNSIFLKFDGGKGVATTFGAILAISPPAFVILGLVWLAITYFLRIVSVASLAGTLTIPLSAFIFGDSISEIAFGAVIFLSIAVTHRGNIKRLLKGEEKPIQPGSG